jgi:hypothetical protein
LAKRKARRSGPLSSEPMRLGHVGDASVDKACHLCFAEASSLLKLLLDESERVHGEFSMMLAPFRASESCAPCGVNVLSVYQSLRKGRSGAH